jgi:hypothetical protein
MLAPQEPKTSKWGCMGRVWQAASVAPSRRGARAGGLPLPPLLEKHDSACECAHHAEASYGHATARLPRFNPEIRASPNPQKLAAATAAAAAAAASGAGSGKAKGKENGGGGGSAAAPPVPAPAPAPVPAPPPAPVAAAAKPPAGDGKAGSAKGPAAAAKGSISSMWAKAGAKAAEAKAAVKATVKGTAKAAPAVAAQKVTRPLGGGGWEGSCACTLPMANCRAGAW